MRFYLEDKGFSYESDAPPYVTVRAVLTKLFSQDAPPLCSRFSRRVREQLLNL
jgi:hypothetical protein